MVTLFWLSFFCLSIRLFLGICRFPVNLLPTSFVPAYSFFLPIILHSSQTFSLLTSMKLFKCCNNTKTLWNDLLVIEIRHFENSEMHWDLINLRYMQKYLRNRNKSCNNKKAEKKKKAKLNWCKIEVVTDLENAVTENQFSKTIMGWGENGQPLRVTESFTSHSKCNIYHSGMKASHRFLKDLFLRNQYLKWWNF